MPVNVGLMMFTKNPEQFFPYSRIEVVEFHDGSGDSFSEKIFKGPIHKQLTNALRYIESMYVREEVRKVANTAKANRFYNYPFLAIEEALVNAVYHRDYNKREPIEVRIKLDRIEIQSFPGPLPPVTMKDLNRGEALRVREYRNRRIGDFLKELHLTEGRCTGIPKIQKALRKNGSPEAIFETNDDCSYFLITIPIHPLLKAFRTDSSLGETLNETLNETLTSLQLKIVCLVRDFPAVSYDEIAEKTARDRSTIARNIKVLKEKGIMERHGSKKRGHWRVSESRIHELDYVPD